jgi:hypothetical protein
MDHHFLTNGTIYGILKPFFQDVYNALGRDINSATTEDYNSIIFNCEQLKNSFGSYSWDVPLLKLRPDAFINHVGFNLSLYDFLILVKGMIMLHHNSFNIDYSKNCPPVVGTQIVKDPSVKIQNNSLILTENLYCEYSLYLSNPIVLFMSSFSLDRITKNILYIYNVCSDTKNTKISNKVTKDIFSKMLKIFSSLNPNFEFFFLFVEQNNPSFSKAFSLYYNNGFMPIINTIETNNINILSRMIGCLDPNNICNYNTTSKILMVKSYNSTFYENYFSPVTELNKQVKRGIKFYDATLAFSYRCYCLLERYFTENILICQEFMENFSELFVIENKENRTIVDEFSNNYFNRIDGYTQLAIKNPNSFKFITENVNLFRIVSTVNYVDKSILGLDEFFNNDRVRISKFKVRVEVIEMITGNIAIGIKFRYIDKFINFEDDNNGKGYDPKIIDKNLLNYIITAISNIKKQTNLDLGVKKDTIFTFLSCSFYFDSKIDPNKKMGHAVSFIHDNDNEILYFYDPYLIPDRRLKEHTFTLKFLRRVVSEIITVNKRKVSKYDDLSKYTDEKGNNLYCKVQQNFADDPIHSMCVLLSLIPYICLQLVKDFDSKKTKNQLQFYLWFLFFSAIIYRQKKIDGLVQEMEITNYQSNLIIIFPFIFIGIYRIVKDIMDDKFKMGMMHTREDVNLMDKMSIQNKHLSQNLIDILSDINKVVYDKNEIPDKYFS